MSNDTTIHTHTCFCPCVDCYKARISAYRERQETNRKRKAEYQQTLSETLSILSKDNLIQFVLLIVDEYCGYQSKLRGLEEFLEKFLKESEDQCSQ